jgi:peptidoglycan/xylan/chitin deacetylase (PgdA/CDA1 family)
MRKIYYSVILPFLSTSGFFEMMRLCQRDRALVLMYHGVVNTKCLRDRATNMNTILADDLTWQLAYLKEHYTVVPLIEIFNRLRLHKSLTGLAAVTFDDGYFNVYSNAAPILLRLGIPATIFIIAGLVGSGQLTWYDTVEIGLLRYPGKSIKCEGQTHNIQKDRWVTIRAVMAALKAMPIEIRDEFVHKLAFEVGIERAQYDENYRLMDWSEILALQSNGISFGVHSYSHPNLSKTLPANLRCEIDVASQIVSERLSIPMHALCFCYPDGDYNRLIRDKVEAAGLCGAVTVGEALVRPSEDPYAVPRIGVYRNQSSAMFYDSTVGFTRRLKSLLSK